MLCDINVSKKVAINFIFINFKYIYVKVSCND